MPVSGGVETAATLKRNSSKGSSELQNITKKTKTRYCQLIAHQKPVCMKVQPRGITAMIVL